MDVHDRSQHAGRRDRGAPDRPAGLVSGADVAVLVFGIGLTAALPLVALILRRHPEPCAV